MFSLMIVSLHSFNWVNLRNVDRYEILVGVIFVDRFSDNNILMVSFKLFQKMKGLWSIFNPSLSGKASCLLLLPPKILKQETSTFYIRRTWTKDGYWPQQWQNRTIGLRPYMYLSCPPDFNCWLFHCLPSILVKEYQCCCAIL